MQKLIYLTALVSLIHSVAFCQSAKPMKTSIGSGNVQTMNGRYKIASIIGQPSPVSPIKNNALQLLQGFQHPSFSNSDRAAAKNLQVYPNPTSDGKISLLWENDFVREEIRVTLIDGYGREIFTIDADRNGPKVNLEFPRFANGIYHLKVEGEKSGFHYAKIFFK